MNNRTLRARVGAVLLVLALCLTVLPAAAASGSMQTVYLDSAEEFAAFAKSCSLDTWSQGKTFILRADISLSGVDFTPAASFGGTFEGRGHTISDFNLTENASPAGLFGTILPGGRVANLNVAGSVAAGGDKIACGGIAGENYGKIVCCTFTGMVQGDTQIGGIVGGVFSATEGSAIAVVYALILAFCYRSINLKSLWKIIVDSAKMSGMVVFLVGVSNILGWVMAFLQIPDAVAAALLSLTSNKYIILLIMNVILLVSGTFMDVTPAILIFTPLFLPICQSFGMSTIQFGLILVYNLCIGNITPPVGNALFVGIKVGRTSLSKVMPYMLMYYVAIIGGLLLVTFIPAVSIALPQAMGLM